MRWTQPGSVGVRLGSPSRYLAAGDSFGSGGPGSAAACWRAGRCGSCGSRAVGTDVVAPRPGGGSLGARQAGDRADPHGQGGEHATHPGGVGGRVWAHRASVAATVGSASGQRHRRVSLADARSDHAALCRGWSSGCLAASRRAMAWRRRWSVTWMYFWVVRMLACPARSRIIRSGRRARPAGCRTCVAGRAVRSGVAAGGHGRRVWRRCPRPRPGRGRAVRDLIPG